MKNYPRLQKLAQRLYFTTEDVAETLNIKKESARVQCTRYVKQGIFIRLKNNFYVLDQRWQNFSSDNLFQIANFLQVPSYISFMTALSIHEVTTQVQRAFIESACLKRSVRFEVRGTAFNYYKIKKEYYFGFFKKEEIFIATPEKAFADAVYLYSFGKYPLDFDSIDIGKLDETKLKKVISVYPQKTRRIAEKICGI